ncbi:Hypothetical_protein [Hexamita inflata]|uniref:Hypothetical_protein n=1 Tax=Hexamita inflata TaxID=28002 RepID=A0AA86RKS5_9EUKA|nr:Hypothetical protein HINF_LOCUS64046 [Hexamita inflata]CAI9976404.1 Hypothetical protein HINF_LOCUS64049 [Hexamita inflata]
MNQVERQMSVVNKWTPGITCELRYRIQNDNIVESEVILQLEITLDMKQKYVIGPGTPAYNICTYYLNFQVSSTYILINKRVQIQKSQQICSMRIKGEVPVRVFIINQIEYFVESYQKPQSL